LQHHSQSNDTSDIRVGGVAFDKDGNLWAVCTHTNNCLSKLSGGVWTGYSIPLNNSSDLGQLLIDRNNQKWMLMRFEDQNPNSILVFTENGSQAVKLNSSVGSGNIPGNNVFAIAEDLNGEIWVGTEQGIGVFYSPENIFVPGQNFDAQQVLVQQGTYTQYLMENETVTAIAVDGGNNKWIGTDRGGLYQFSPDGTTQLNHFTQDDSPLFSDRITCIAINQNGEVFVGTDKGVISYRGAATPPQNTEKVYAFPNPVKKDYTGLIAITGLVGNASVKITDVNGTLVYATTAEGGQAIWDGRNFDGRKALTGIYLVFASTSTGTEKAVTKILIIN
jgi:ligand-binding sensor domain-containing protein